MTAFFRLATQFMPGVPAEIARADFRRYVREMPNADPPAARGAFCGDDYLGGYLIEERWLRIGPARLRVGCVGVVITDPAHRGQGIGKALMRDSFAHARSRGQALLLLHGLADYYRPFGYADVFDATEHAVSRAAILDAPPSHYRLREATTADAAALLDLYERHYGPHPGSFARGLAQQAYLIDFSMSLDRSAYQQRDGAPFVPPVVAVDELERVRGYLIAPWGPLHAFGSEVAADDWPATLALLQHHARLLDGLPPPEQVRWPLPPDALAAMLLADHFVVERTSRSRPWANWEAAIVDPLAVLEAMLPAWQARWRHQPTQKPMTLGLTIDGMGKRLHLAPDAVTLEAISGDEALAVTLTGPALAPLLFGFRSIAWAALQEGQAIPMEAMPVLEVLFPPRTPWIAPTDGC